MGKGNHCPGFSSDLAPGDGAAGGFALGETAAAAGAVRINPAGKGIPVQHRAAFPGMVSKTEPTASVGPAGNVCGDAGGNRPLLKIRYFRRRQLQ